MSRPVKRRTVQSYRRDVENLNRLRVAIKLDTQLDRTLSDKACLEIDKLMATVIDLINQVEKKAEKKAVV